MQGRRDRQSSASDTAESVEERSRNPIEEVSAL